MKPRYVCQNDNFSCGVYSIINAMKWMGQKATLKNDYKNIKKIIRCCAGYGCSPEHFDRHVVNKLKAKRIFNITIGKMNKILNSGNGLILVYRCDDLDGSHLIFVDKIVDEQYNVINNHPGHRIKKVSKQLMRNRIRRKVYCIPKNIPTAWEIKK